MTDAAAPITTSNDELAPTTPAKPLQHKPLQTDDMKATPRSLKKHRTHYTPTDTKPFVAGSSTTDDTPNDAGSSTTDDMPGSCALAGPPHGPPL
eukprot:14927780-Heterocapsa_arctica.AAC.2